jgi:hypothetical protein
VEREATYTLQALGLAFGRVFLTENPGYDWWMVEDEYGGVSRARRRARSCDIHQARLKVDLLPAHRDELGDPKRMPIGDEKKRPIARTVASHLGGGRQQSFHL